MSGRMDKVNALLKKELTTAVGKEFGGSNWFATVTEVKVSPDLRHADCWISLIPNRDNAWQAIEARRNELQKYLADRLELKRTPVIVLKRDRGAENAERITELLRR